MASLKAQLADNPGFQEWTWVTKKKKIIRKEKIGRKAMSIDEILIGNDEGTSEMVRRQFSSAISWQRGWQNDLHLQLHNWHAGYACQENFTGSSWNLENGGESPGNK